MVLCDHACTNCIRKGQATHVSSYKNRALKQINVPGMTQSGKAWLSWAIDPFHDDVGTSIEGLPDQSGHATIIRTFNKFQNISYDGEVKWDCWIFTLPIQDGGRGRPATRDIFGSIVKDNGKEVQLSTFNIWKWPSTKTPFEALADGTLESSVITGDENSAAGDISLTRIIAGGFEVCNDTAELYKDGHVVTYSTPSNRSRDYALYSPDAEYGPVFVCRGHPTTEEEAKAIRNCTSWKASEGVYVPLRINIKESDFEQPAFIPYYFESSRNVDGYERNLLIDLIDGDTWQAQPTKYSAMDNVGAWFSGLNPQTVLTANFRVITETAPVNNLGLLSYNPTYTPADPMALNMYREALKHLPPGVTYDENGSAEFWSKALGVISKVAAPIGMLVGQPAVGTAVSGLAKAAQVALEKKIEKKVESKISNTINSKVKQSTKNLNTKIKNVEKKTNAMPVRRKK